MGNDVNTFDLELIPPRKALDRYAQRREALGRPVFVVQVGANDGKINDPVYPVLNRYSWSGLLVEPIPDVFENELKKTYEGNDRVRLANVAIAPVDGVMPLHKVAFSSDRWATGLSSFRRESLEEHIHNGYIAEQAARSGATPPKDKADWIHSIDVRTVPLRQLLGENDVARFDVMCIDTEGYDYEVLKLSEVERYAPDIIIYESKNLSKSDYRNSLDMLKPQYRLYWYRGDTLAIRKGSDADRATRVLRSRLWKAAQRLASKFRNR